MNAEDKSDDVDIKKEVNTDLTKKEDLKSVIPDLDISTPYIDSSVGKYKKKRKILKLIGTCFCGLVLLFYFGGVLYNTFYFADNTTVNDIDVSNMSLSAAENLIKEDMNSYSLTVRFDSSEHEITTDDNAFTITQDKTIKEIKHMQNPFLWFMYFFDYTDLEVKYTVDCDRDEIERLISRYYELNPDNMTEAVDATVSMEGGEAHIVDEIEGTKLDAYELADVICENLTEQNESLDVRKAGLYDEAEITADSEIITKKLEVAEEYLSIEAAYDFNGYEVEISKEDMASMAYITDDGEVKISEANVRAYAKKFAEKYSTVGTEREFITHDGEKILVSGGYYGWKIDEEAEEDELLECMNKGSDFLKRPACTTTGYTLSEMNDIGENYVEIDLTNQHVYVYQDGKQVYDTLCVSGNESRGMSTPGGVYPITYKQENAILRGANYATPVSYWMPFNGDIGMHDATWKTQFGADYYKTDGSHGCINLSLEAAETIYPYVEKGMPVVCYWRNEITYLDN